MGLGAEGGTGPGEGGFGGGTGDSGSSPAAIDAAMSIVPFLGAANALGSMFGMSLGHMAQGDPNPDFGTGVSGADSGVGVGGGPTREQKIREYRESLKKDRTPPFLINPYQVQNDINANSMWGAPTMMPQMNPMMGQMTQSPMGMYGAMSPFNWGQYYGGFK